MNPMSFSRFFQTQESKQRPSYAKTHSVQSCYLQGGGGVSVITGLEEEQQKTMGCHSLICVMALCIEELLLPTRNAESQVSVSVVSHKQMYDNIYSLIVWDKGSVATSFQ